MWNRSFHDRSSSAPNRSRITRAQMRRAARYLAISSKKSLWALKKNDMRGAKSSTSSPASTPHWTYSMPSRSVNASSCDRRRAGLADVIAADRDRVPARHVLGAEREHVGDEPHRRPRREDVFLLRDEFLEDVVLNRARQRLPAAPCCSATTRYIAKIIAAGELIVIDVVMSPRAMPSNSASMSASEVTLTPHLPTSPSDSGWSGSRPISVGRSNATLSPVPPAASSAL